ncbi:hypothetical protein ACF0H5_011304 [Mactra antiquata]
MALFVLISIISITLLTPVSSLRNYECIPPNIQEVSIGIANCSSQSLLHVPPNLPHNIRVLDLSNNLITQLTDYSFLKYESLEILYLRNNTLSSLEYQVFNGLRKLLYLDLSINNLDQIPSQTFSDIKGLLTMSLSGNRITSILPYAFRNVSKLTNLYLSGNHIQSIHPLGFNGLYRLQQLDLQNNALSTLNGTAFTYFSSELKEIKLFDNPWYCDCNLRWMINWLTNSSDSVAQRLRWKYTTTEPVCTGPAIVEQKPFSTLTSDWFICPIRMYSKARNIETSEGSEVQLYCKYMADPPVDIHWLKNGKLVNLDETYKYKVENDGNLMVTSRLHIYNFKKQDIAEYECSAENKLGRVFDSSYVTLKGIDPLTIVDASKVDSDDKDRTRNAIIASATIGGVVFLLAVIGLILCAISKCKVYHKRKKESIRMSFEEHLKANGIIEPNPKNEPTNYDDIPDGTLSVDADMDEDCSMYDSLQRPRLSSSINTNTYISFKTEFSEPDEMTTSYSQSQQTNNNSKGSDGSQCESTSPLLENISPILIDPHDPFYEANLYVPVFASTDHYNRSNHYNYNDDNGFLTPHSVREFIPCRDDHGFILPMARSVGHMPQYPYRSSTLPHNGHIGYEQTYIPNKMSTLPHGYSPNHMYDYGSAPVVRSNSVSRNYKSASVGHLSMSPPKKPPRSFNSKDTVSLHSQCSLGEREHGFKKLTLPKPGTVDKYGTAV